MRFRTVCGRSDGSLDVLLRWLRRARRHRIFDRLRHQLPVLTPTTMTNILLGLIVLACFVYLLVAVLRPEKF